MNCEQAETFLAAYVFDDVPAPILAELREHLDAFFESTQRYVTGAVRVKLFKGNAAIVGRKSPHSLYRWNLATYDTGDQFDHTAATGFMTIWGLPEKVEALAGRKKGRQKTAAKKKKGAGKTKKKK